MNCDHIWAPVNVTFVSLERVFILVFEELNYLLKIISRHLVNWFKKEKNPQIK